MSELPFKVKALYEYKSPHDDDLNFGAGEIITVTEEEDTEWFYGHYVDSEGTAKEGIFPRNFVERYSPEAPPRPARAPRSRKEGPAEQPRPVEDVPNEPAVTTSGPQEVSSAPAPTQAAPKEPEQKLPPPVSKTQASSEAPSKSTITAKPQLSGRDAVSSTKPARSTADTEDKPAPSSFKDRIAAFNKPAAPPVAPVKPAALGGSTFVKKPFVPPPPSRDAYVPPPREPPQKIYVREEKETTPAAYQQLDAPARVSQSKDTVAEEAEAKPTSLKERIALLQKQQLENAMRHTEGSQKKETAKRPTPQRTDSVEDPGSTRVSTERTSMDPAPKAESPVEATHPTARDEGLARPPVKSTIRRPHLHAAANDFPSDSNDADQSGADEVTEDNSTEQETSDPVPQRAIGRPQAKADGESDGEEVKHEDEQGAGSAEEEAGAAGGDEDDAEIDPELKRRMELRERMAKMSGGMGMHGMFGVPAGLPRPPAPPRKAKPEPGAAPVAEEGSEGARGELASYAPPVQVLPLPIRTQEQRSETGASQPLIEAEEESATPLTAAKSPTVPDVGRDEDERGPPVPAHQKERTSMESGKRA
ncbi:MAG: hypothetical protein M1823_000109 [Watsoniomyces obsoletus]|nr:MAG: hypothetical protein M1823_000109 [Watsoniomyces obsoletus]